MIDLTCVETEASKREIFYQWRISSFVIRIARKTGARKNKYGYITRKTRLQSSFLNFWFRKKMGRKHGKYSRLLFKLFLLIQLYCYHNLEVGAVPSQHGNSKTCDECHNHNGGTYFEKNTEKNLQRTKRPARMIPGHYLTYIIHFGFFLIKLIMNS